MTVHSIVAPQARLSRVIDNIKKASLSKWNPSNETLIELRRMSRANYTLTEAYNELSPLPIVRESFRG